MRFRPMLRTSFNVRTTSGRLRSQSSAALQLSRMLKTIAYGAHSFSLVDQPLAAPAPTAPKFTTSLVSAPKNPTQYATLWCEATASPQDLENALQMFSGECSGPH